MIRLEECKQDFEWDGALRDIYVFQTTLQDWQTLSDFLRLNFELEYSIDGKEQPFPKLVSEVFAVRAQANTLLNFQAGKILFSCHFFTPGEIEFDLDPRNIKTQSDLDVLLDFMRQAGNSVCKPVVLTVENTPEIPIISYESAEGEFKHRKISA
jgi:hypothetical protein